MTRRAQGTLTRRRDDRVEVDGGLHRVGQASSRASSPPSRRPARGRGAAPAGSGSPRGAGLPRTGMADARHAARATSARVAGAGDLVEDDAGERDARVVGGAAEHDGGGRLRLAADVDHEQDRPAGRGRDVGGRAGAPGFDAERRRTGPSSPRRCTRSAPTRRAAARLASRAGAIAQASRLRLGRARSRRRGRPDRCNPARISARRREGPPNEGTQQAEGDRGLARARRGAAMRRPGAVMTPRHPGGPEWRSGEFKRSPSLCGDPAQGTDRVRSSLLLDGKLGERQAIRPEGEPFRPSTSPDEAPAHALSPSPWTRRLPRASCAAAGRRAPARRRRRRRPTRAGHRRVPRPRHHHAAGRPEARLRPGRGASARRTARRPASSRTPATIPDVTHGALVVATRRARRPRAPASCSAPAPASAR